MKTLIASARVRGLAILVLSLLSVARPLRGQPAGSIDSTFTPGTTFALIQKIGLQADGKILIGGLITNYNGGNNKHLARLNADGTLDSSFTSTTGFTPNISPVTITDFLVQNDGKIIVTGDFAGYNGATHANIVRLNADGSFDSSFQAEADQPVRSILALPNGKVLIVGNFTKVKGIARKALAVLNATDGSLDAFTANYGSMILSAIQTAGVQSDGRIVIGGGFLYFSGGFDVRLTARLNTDGTIDPTFIGGKVSSTLSAAKSLKVQSDDKVVISGLFGTVDGKEHNGLARLNANGTIDDSFTGPGFGSNTLPGYLALQTNGKILVSGQLLSYNSNGLFGYVRVNSDGAYDDTFTIAFNSGFTTSDVLLQPDGKILLSGGMGIGVNVQYLARLNGDPVSTGNGPLITQDPSDQTVPAGATVTFTVVASNATSYQWRHNGTNIAGATSATLTITGVKQTDAGIYAAVASNANGSSTSKDTLLNPVSPAWPDMTFPKNGSDPLQINAFHKQADGKILVAGSFSKIFGFTRTGIARLNPDATMDDTFNKTTTLVSEVQAVAAQSTGKPIIVGNIGSSELGSFGITRLNLDGSVDTSFTPGTGTDDTVYSVAVRSDDHILIGGFFGKYNGIARKNLARLNPSGVSDRWAAAWPPDLTPYAISALALQSDGKILAGGRIFRAAAEVIGIVRFNEDGSFDSGFTPAVIAGAFGGGVDQVWRILIQGDGKILVGGYFGAVNGAERDGVARLNPDGSLDNTFHAPLNGSNSAFVRALALQADGRIIVSGAFRSYSGVSAGNIVRLQPDGTLDGGFSTTSGATGLAGDEIRALAVLPDGKILAGGQFTAYNDIPFTRLVRLHGGEGAVTQQPRLGFAFSPVTKTMHFEVPSGFVLERTLSLLPIDWQPVPGASPFDVPTTSASGYFRLVAQ